ncbi:bacteriocin biosynthesis cyclodehydratase domain-containing protein [Psychromicrobium silvestre]|uniref:Bacteriocin biosynthesis cyclodehydratase domain-containing protein n=1 Tax=Psychromicrobium silvestre TaxID=1645614 RepID=A0A7Y9LTM0_9MICC|nr:TOMM precursor leader peptide-binding protein [Psychromicrobium silvestre]NYE95341.1 bacteriocin biosynthesis cyclodehydratase domain-containing protein [Psychromicrobium silvestre]
MDATYALAPGVRQADFEDSYVLVCGKSIVRFRENQDLAKALFGFLQSPRTVEEVAGGVPGLDRPGRLLAALHSAGILSRPSGLIGQLIGLAASAGTDTFYLDIPVELESRLPHTLGSSNGLSLTPGEQRTPTIVIRSGVPEMIERCRQLWATETCHLPVLPFDGGKLIIGPAVVPGLTACFECLMARKAAMTDWPDEYLRFHQGISAGGFTDADLALGVNLALRLAQGAFSQQLGELIGACTVFDPISLTMYSSRVWSVPRCPTCSKSGKLSTSYPWLAPTHSAAALSAPI